MTKKNFLSAIVDGIVYEAGRDDSVFVMGQDLRSGLYGNFPVDEMGERLRNVPISEAANVGAAVGAALTGMRPVLDMTIATFMYSGMDQIVNQAAKSRLMFGGQSNVPLVIRAAMFYGASQAAHHTDRPYPMFMNVPGLKIAVPTTPADAQGLMISAIREDDPVLFFEDSNLWGTRGDVPDGEDAVIPFGKAKIRREGSDVTIVAIANCVRIALNAAKKLEDDGISAEVIDPRTLVPFDWETVFQSVRKTGKLVIVDPAFRTCSAASEISATVVQECWDMLDVPPARVTTPDVQIPFSPPLEKELLPSVDRVLDAVRDTVAGKRYVRVPNS